jgi:hypothetical protein
MLKMLTSRTFNIGNSINQKKTHIIKCKKKMVRCAISPHFKKVTGFEVWFKAQGIHISMSRPFPFLNDGSC